jgi:hypothetical protein
MDNVQRQINRIANKAWRDNPDTDTKEILDMLDGVKKDVAGGNIKFAYVVVVDNDMELSRYLTGMANPTILMAIKGLTAIEMDRELDEYQDAE